MVEGVEGLRLAIRLGGAAMRRQEFVQSREILTRVVAAPEFGEMPPEDRVAALFALGRTMNALGEHREAIRLFRRILVDYPGLVRVRLELARSLFILGEDDVAEQHFRLVLAGELPEAVEVNIRRYLREIHHRRRWSVDLQVAGIGNTNVNVAPTIREIEMTGGPARLDDDARAQSGVGIATLVSGEYRHPLSANARLRIGGYSSHTAYSDSTFNNTVLGGRAGPHFLFDGGSWGESSISLLAHGYRRWYGGQKLSYGIGPAVEWTSEPADAIRMVVRLEHVFLKYDERNDYDGTFTSAMVRPAFILSPTSYATVVLGAGYDRTDFDRLRNWQYRIGGGYHKDLSRGFTVALQPEYRSIHYPREWPNFGARRRDHLYRFRADVLNRRLDILGFTPVLGYRYHYRASTIDLYDFEQHRGELTFTRRF